MNKVKEVKVTGKMELATKAVKELGGKANARQVLDFLNENYADRTDLKTFNAVNATLAYVAKAGMASKAKVQYGDKLLTQYTVSE